jgi:hypothetical protein
MTRRLYQRQGHNTGIGGDVVVRVQRSCRHGHGVRDREQGKHGCGRPGKKGKGDAIRQMGWWRGAAA